MAVSAICSNSFAQPKFEGEINYTISYLEVPDEIKGMESMLPSTMMFHIKGSKVALVQKIMGGSQIVISDSDTGESSILMDMMGQKFAISISKAEAEAAAEEMGKPIIAYSSGSKEIAGYNCQKANITLDEDVIEIWYTKDIKGAVHTEFKELDGFPMQYITFNQGMKLEITATEVTKASQVDSLFKVPEGYTTMTMTEFSQMMGGSY
jgi:hypothetical protein